MVKVGMGVDDRDDRLFGDAGGEDVVVDVELAHPGVDQDAAVAAFQQVAVAAPRGSGVFGADDPGIRADLADIEVVFKGIHADQRGSSFLFTVLSLSDITIIHKRPPQFYPQTGQNEAAFLYQTDKSRGRSLCF